MAQCLIVPGVEENSFSEHRLCDLKVLFATGNQAQQIKSLYLAGIFANQLLADLFCLCILCTVGQAFSLQQQLVSVIVLLVIRRFFYGTNVMLEIGPLYSF